MSAWHIWICCLCAERCTVHLDVCSQPTGSSRPTSISSKVHCYLQGRTKKRNRKGRRVENYGMQVTLGTALGTTIQVERVRVWVERCGLLSAIWRILRLISLRRWALSVAPFINKLDQNWPGVKINSNFSECDHWGPIHNVTSNSLYHHETPDQFWKPPKYYQPANIDHGVDNYGAGCKASNSMGEHLITWAKLPQDPGGSGRDDTRIFYW